MIEPPFERPPAVGTPRAAFHGTWLGKVVDDADPDGKNRVQIRLYALDGVDGHDAPMWARVAVPFAGNGYGALLIPAVDEEVLVTFVQGDPRFPIVVGSLWNGRNQAPEAIGSNGVDRWILFGRNGSKVAIVEESASSATITLETANGVQLELTDSGTEATITASDSTVTLKPGEVSVQTSGTVKVQASQVQVTASQVSVSAAVSQFSGVVQCDTLIATSVVGTTYTPGAGNVW